MYSPSPIFIFQLNCPVLNETTKSITMYNKLDDLVITTCHASVTLCSHNFKDANQNQNQNKNQ